MCSPMSNQISENEGAGNGNFDNSIEVSKNPFSEEDEEGISSSFD